ncbi:MAG: UDP-2,3-diacylglucosamine diphosphatase, partial [Pedobacter sp.]
TMQHSKWLAKLGAIGYDTLILLNSVVNSMLTFFGKEKMSFSKKIKAKFKDAVKFINSFEETAAELAVENGYQYVVCGHIHQPEKRNILVNDGEVLYLNSGDWVENLTALEYNEGNWEVFKYEAQNFVKDEIEQGELSDGDDLTGKLDVNILLQKIKLEIA